MVYLIGEVDFGDESEIDLVKGLEKRTRMEKGMNIVKNILPNQAPKLLVKEGWDSLRFRSLLRVKLMNCPIYFSSSHRSVQLMLLILIQFWNW